MGAVGSWPEGECCLRWIESCRGSGGASGEVDRFEVEVLAEVRLRGGGHWVVRQIQKSRGSGKVISAADEEELRPLRAERARWTSELSRLGIRYGLPEFDADPLGEYVRVYGSLPDQPIETWDERFLVSTTGLSPTCSKSSGGGLAMPSEAANRSRKTDLPRR